MNRRKIITAAAAAVLFIAAVISIILFINYDMSMQKAIVDLYFMNSDGTGIAAEQHEIRYKDDNELILNTIARLTDGPSNSQKGRVIPKGTDVNRIVLDGAESITVDFSAEFLTDDPARNVLDTYAVVKTLCATGRAASAEVTVMGSPITDRDGNALGFISASDINLENEEYSSEMRDIILYFADRSETGLVKEERTIKITDQQPIEQYIINELIKGPADNSVQSLLSGKTVLMSVDIEDNICYLNFKSSFINENAGSSDHEQLVIYSIVNSLTELPSISRIQFYMDGKRVNNFGAVEIKDCIARDISIINDR